MPISERVVERKILVAVDFGTTYSGIAWGQTGEADAQNIVQHWPDKNSTGQDFHGKSIDKVPTILRYSGDGVRWGYQIESTEQRHEWFKLGLDPSVQREKSSLAGRYPGSTQLPMQLSSEYAISSAKLATDYLTALRLHAEYMLLQTVRKAALKGTPREYVISVPAVWTEMARDLTTTCAIDAEMGPRGRLHIVSEPEAAAMYAFKEMNSCGLDKGDTFVICDAGGGTVDLISYTVSSLDPMLQLNEAAPGSGSACGSIFLNRIFAQTLKNKFGGDPEWKSDPDIFATAMEHFENFTKSSFNGKQSESVPVHGLSDRPGIKKGKLTLSILELRDIFEPVVSEILTLIRDQIKQTAEKVKLILLVGGFGSSFYLRSRIQETVGSGVEVKMAPNCQTAVVRGALMKGMAEVKDVTSKLPRIRVGSRKARKHYGTECYTAYKPRRKPHDDGHSPERKQPNPFTGQDHVQFMKWFVKKGEVVKESEPAIFGFQTDQLVAEGLPKKFSIDVYYHEDPENTGAPEYKTNNVEKLGTVKADIGGIDPSLLKKQRGYDGEEYYVMDFDIEMRFFAARMEYTPVYRYEGGGQQRFEPARMEFA